MLTQIIAILTSIAQLVSPGAGYKLNGEIPSSQNGKSTSLESTIPDIPKTILLDPRGKIVAIDPNLEKPLPSLLTSIAPGK